MSRIKHLMETLELAVPPTPFVRPESDLEDGDFEPAVPNENGEFDYFCEHGHRDGCSNDWENEDGNDS